MTKHQYFNQAQQPAFAAHVARGADLNKQYGLHLPKDALAVVMRNVPGLSGSASLHPLTDTFAIAQSQQVVLADRGVAAVLVFDLRAKDMACFLKEGASNDAFWFVLTDPNHQTARALNVELAREYRRERPMAVKFFSSFQETNDQDVVFIDTVARTGYRAVEAACVASNRNFKASQVHFRPVLSSRHLELLGTKSLDDLVKAGRSIGSLENIPGLQIVGVGSKEEMLDLADAYRKPRH